MFCPIALLATGMLLCSPAIGHSESGVAEFRRGVVVSCPRAGQIWGSPEMAQSLEEMTEMGVEWVAIHPYAGVRRDGSVRFRPAADVDYLARAADLAEEAGVHLFWKPHLAYWGSFQWRGAITFGDDGTAWRRFFDGYRAFIVDQARFAQSIGVDLFAVGIEYELTTHHEQEWRQIIAEVRSVFSGRLTYAANWDTLGKVPFWDALDLIGVHAYFPLSQDEYATRESIERGWDSALEELGRLSRALGGKPVLFAEIGYPRSARAAIEPWVPALEDSRRVRTLRQTLIEIAIDRVEATPYIEGMFWWKWIPGDNRWDQDFSMRDAEARRAIQELWGGGRPTLSTAQ